MNDTASNIYRTTGCVEPAPYGLFDDEYRFITTTGAEFHLWSEEIHHLFSAIHSFQCDRKLIPLPELPIITQWNMLKGVFDIDASATVVTEVPKLIDALRVLCSNYADYESAGKQRGFAALSVDDLNALIVFLVNAESHGDIVTIAEY